MPKSVYVAHNATVIGDVHLGDGVSVWYDAVIRGDTGPVSIGAGTNVQDRVLIKGGSMDASASEVLGTEIGKSVTIGHLAIIEPSRIGDNCLIGNGAIVSEGSRMNQCSMLAAGAVLKSGDLVATGELWAGNPAKFFRKLTDKEMDNLQNNADEYVKLGAIHKQEIGNYIQHVRKTSIAADEERPASAWDGWSKEWNKHNLN